MVLEPLSRRPLRLERATVAAALAAEPVPFARPPVLGPDSASIVVVSYDGLPFTRLCLTSLLANTAGEFELIVVDNGSIDGSEEYLVSLARADARVSVLLCGRNGGFPAACNRGLSLARGEHLVLVNNDTMFAPAWLGRLKAHLRSREVGLVGPVTNRIGNEAEVEVGYRTWCEYLAVARRRARDQAGEWIELRTPAMFCVAMRRDAYERIGPLDERYEIGMLEDDDYAERARQAGYQLRCAEDVLVHHFGEAAFGRLVASGEHARILRANKRRYAEKWGRDWAPYPRRAKRSYELDSERLRETLSRTVPAGATVLVVSRGDDGLLQLDGQHALHFPQDTDGGWSGHHPADSEEAIGHLERLRAAGAEYLAVPPAYGWWLDHYAGLREHLDGHHEAIVREERGLAIYRLRASEDRCLQEALP
jgi:GT2 family glycosyltransferase